MVKMPLDIAILDENDRPVVSRSISVSEHEALARAARGAGSKYLARMHDYYGDAEIAVHELQAFRDELRSLRAQSSLPHEVIDLVDVLESMSVRAQREGRKIVAIAD